MVGGDADHMLFPDVGDLADSVLRAQGTPGWRSVAAILRTAGYEP